MTALITLTATGADTGPTFNLYTELDAFTTPFETGVAKGALIAGYTSVVVPDFATTVRVQSVGVCTTFVDMALVYPTTTTTTTIAPTTTTTTTVAVPDLVLGDTNYVSGELACDDVGTTEPMWFNNAPGVPQIGDFIYQDSGLVTPFPGGNMWWYDTTNDQSLEIDNTGEVTNLFVCPL